MFTHLISIDSAAFAELLRGQNKIEIENAEPLNYAVGDVINFVRIGPDGRYTGHRITTKITAIEKNGSITTFTVERCDELIPIGKRKGRKK